MHHVRREATENGVARGAVLESTILPTTLASSPQMSRPYFSGPTPFVLLLVLALVGTFATGFLTYRHVILTGHSLNVEQSFLCRSQGNISCDAILLTDYATLFGFVSSAALGLMGCVFVLWCTVNGILNERMRKVAWILLVLYFFAAIGFSWYFLYIMAFQVDFICPWCIVVHVVNIVSLVVVVIVSIRKRQELLLPEIASVSERIYFVVSGVLLSVAVFLVPLAYEKSLVFQDIKIQYEEIANDPAVIGAILRNSPKYNIPIGPEDPIYGSPEAPYALVVFSDFRCPACAKAHEMLKVLVAANPTTLRLVFKNFPLDRECNPNLIAAKGDFHPKACEAARAAYAAFLLGGSEAFWSYASILFKHQKRLGGAPWADFARQLGLDIQKFELLMGKDSAAARKVIQDIDLGVELKIAGTPKIFFEGRRIPDQYQGQFLVDALNELVRADHPEQGNIRLFRR